MLPTSEFSTPTTPRPRISVVAPCHNEEATLSALEKRVVAVCNSVVGEDYEIVLVNDGSIDTTWQVIDDLAQKNPHIVGVNLSRNFGHQLALTAGLNVCRGEYVLVIDADLQDPPELLPEMMKLAEAGADVVYGQRTERPGDSALRRLASAVFYRMLNLVSDVKIPPDTGDFRLISRRVLDILNAMPEEHRYIRGMISWIGFKQVPLLYKRDIRTEGETSYTFARLLSFSLDAIAGFSIKPLRYASYLGGIVVLFSMLAVILIITSFLFYDVEVAGWTSIMISIWFFGGVQLLFFGLVGEYLGRTFVQTKQRPKFIISDIIRRTDSNES
jgi:glycosyltransferase involved in cell wall biosynthesis